MQHGLPGPCVTFRTGLEAHPTDSSHSTPSRDMASSITTPSPLIDTHVHLDEEAFGADRDEVVARAVAAGVVRMVTIGTTADTNRRAIEIAGQYPAVFAAVGIQPNYAAQAKAGDWDVIERLAGEPRVVAIGETGLDRYWDYAPFDV